MNEINYIDIDNSNNIYNNNDNNMTNDNNDGSIIETLGVSKKLGTSVLNELDSRTTLKYEQLRDDGDNPGTVLNGKDSQTFSHFFNIQHDSEFQKMDSINLHYSLNDQNNNDNNRDQVPSTPSKKNTVPDLLESDSIKRIKTYNHHTPPPVNEITRRIRRLRIRNNSSNGTPHSSSRTNSKSSVSPIKTIKNTPLTKAKPMEPPTFLKPTINSLNKIRRSPVKADLNAIRTGRPNLSVSTPVNTTTQRRVNSTSSVDNNKPLTSADSNTKSTEKRSVSAGSVFDRLYKQSTMSRSNSMNNIEGNEIKRKTNTSYIKFGRSITSGSLANIKAEDTKTRSRPVWR